MFEKYMGRMFPEEPGVGISSKTVSKKPPSKPLKASGTIITRRSLRNVHKVVNYKELPVDRIGVNKKMNLGKMSKAVQAKIQQVEKDKSKKSSEVRPAADVHLKKCDLCNTYFPGHAELKLHMNKVHVRTLFNCPVCELPTFTVENYKLHFQNVHMT